METHVLYGVEYTLLEDLPTRLVQDEPLLIGLQLRNTGLTPWLTAGYPVMVVIRWVAADGQVVHDLPWQPLPKPVPSGETVTLEVRAAAAVPPGDYTLTIELVEHPVAWFRERGVAPWRLPVTVELPRGPRICVINCTCVMNDAVGNHVALQVRTLHEAGFRPLLLAGYIDERLPRSLRRFMVTVGLRQILEPDAYSAPAAEHFRRSAAVIVNYPVYYELVELIREARAPVLFDYHGVTPPAIWGVGQPGYEDVARGVANVNLVRFADYAVAHSQYMVDELVATGLIAPSRVSVQPYAVVKAAGYAAPPDSQLQQQYNLAGKRVLLYVGRMARNKRIHVLVEALPLIRARYPETVLLLVGETGHVYAGYVEEVKARAAELGVADAVIFTGPQNRDRIDLFYQLCDVFVMASIHEGFCMPVMEAMSLGKPVVASAATALPSTVGDAGLLFTPDDHEELARQVMRVLAAYDEESAVVTPTLAQAHQLLVKRKVAFVMPRYGLEPASAAEHLVQAWAEQLVARDVMVELLTTNVVDVASRRTAPLAETEVVNGVLVRRFAIDAVDAGPFYEVQEKAARGEAINRRDEDRWMQHHLRSRALEAYLADHRADYAAVILTPYHTGITYYAAQQAGDRAFHIPWLVDEPVVRFALFREMLEEARGIFFRSAAEAQFARVQLHVANPYTVVLAEQDDHADDALLHDAATVDRLIVSLAAFLQPRSLLAELAQRGIRRALNFTYDRFEAHLIDLVQHMCDQYADWRLFDQVQQQLAAYANGKAEPEPAIDLPATRARQLLDQLRRRFVPAAPQPVAVAQRHDPSAVAHLVSELVDLLRQTRHEQRRLERELALLRDRFVADSFDAG